ncbi:TIGR04282 family arsenosugar biosynthesis glycosyltransferase [Salicola sp. Rm-C-2C1-2]|uniref:TIGR04282 family arsenosugar biosynthesis glycosyltransferase n=1 Tax=Salicola sp. Rm-C-2C1-2 TaxID=3141321 RepID=UPI0032E44606
MQYPPAVMQFAKWPRKGEVKTRLAAELGEGKALDAYLALTEAVLKNLMDSGYPLTFWWDREISEPPGEAEGVLRRLRKGGIPQRVQKGSDLGERMNHALAEAVAHAGAGMIVGSDCPAVTPQYVRRAAQSLETADVVLGPSDDGGFVLIGARRTVPGMLEGPAWGSGQVLEQTQQVLHQKGFQVACLEPLWDVDEPEDWARFQRLR